MSPTEMAVEARTVSRTFGGVNGRGRRAVDAVTFSLARGDALALFGPNGAGKTTLLRLLAGLLVPTSGEACIAGAGVRGDDGAAARGRVGYISHHTMLYAPLTARENVEIAARLHGVDHARDASMRALDSLGIADRAESPVRLLSRGMQQRVSVARAIVHAPAVVLLDEPYSGLDVAGAAALTVVLRELRATGAALVLVTHNVAEGLALASHAAVMVSGRFARFAPSAGTDAGEYAIAYQELVTGGSR